MTITQLIQGSPAKANELFAKLADTSDGAVKTREKLFSELKEELELQARLEEQHLFPVLRKHKETKDLVSDAVDDNKQVRALLADLGQMPKNDPEFAGKLAELRKVFQQHVRDEKKELLPAVRKALSDEEAQGIVEKIETGKAEAEDAKRQEAERRRAEARREREETERRQAEAEEARRQEEERRRAAAKREREEAERREAEARERERGTRGAAAVVGRLAENAAQGASRVVEMGSAAARAGSDVAAQGTRQAADLGTRAVERTVPSAAQGLYGPVAQPALRNLDVLTKLPGVAAQSVSDANRVWVEWMSRTMETGARASQGLLGLRTPQEIAEAQNRFIQEAFQAWFDASSKIWQISVRVSEGMFQSIADGAGQGGGERGPRR